MLLSIRSCRVYYACDLIDYNLAADATGRSTILDPPFYYGSVSFELRLSAQRDLVVPVSHEWNSHYEHIKFLAAGLAT